MPRTVLVVPTAAAVGLTTTCLGLLRSLARHGVRMGSLKPLAPPRADGDPDRSTTLVRGLTALDPPEPAPAARLERRLGAGELDVVMEEVVAAYAPVRDAADVVVVEGLGPGPTQQYSSRINQALAQALDADVLRVAAWPRTPAADSADPGSGNPGPNGTGPDGHPTRTPGAGRAEPAGRAQPAGRAGAA